jgi:hypothetical protein
VGEGLSGSRPKWERRRARRSATGRGLAHVRHGDADVVRARLVGVEPGLDQPILLHSLLSRERKAPSSTPHAARRTCNMTHTMYS